MCVYLRFWDVVISFVRGNCPGRHLNQEVFQLFWVWLQAQYASQRLISWDWLTYCNALLPPKCVCAGVCVYLSKSQMKGQVIDWPMLRCCDLSLFCACSSMLLYWVWVVTISEDDKRLLNTNRETLNLHYCADSNLCPNTRKPKELIIDVRRKAFTHHPIHIDGTEVVLSLIGTLNCSNNKILRRPRLQTSCWTSTAALLRASLPTVLQSDTGAIRNQKLLQMVAKTSQRLLTASLEHNFLLLESSTESTTSITNDLQTVCLPSCPPEGATGAP